MPATTNNQYLENESLAMKYRPLLVLYPEIEDGSRRRDHHRGGHGLGSPPPLEQDYHPRDIRLILDNARLPSMKGKPSREQLLEAMGENNIDYIDLIDRSGPKDVDKFWRVYSEIKNKDDNPDYQRKAYARIIRGSRQFKDYISIQYWLAYFFDDWANVHEMDWEMVSIILKKSESLEEEPVACVYNAHMGSFRMPWAHVQKVDEAVKRNPQGLHPIAYIANGSHASYFSDYPPDFNVAEQFLGNMLRVVIRMANIVSDFIDFVPRFEDGVKHFPDIEVIPQPDEFGRWSGDFRWLNFEGRWGSPVQLSFTERFLTRIPILRTIFKIFDRPIREAGPTGPRVKSGLCWEKPFDWVNLECLDARETYWLEKTSGTNASKH